ncbi:MAG: efflux RND transporter periplasmic adaptor subunit [Patescibacteria group bacterium]|jgi:HlyD family secretion protein
MKLSLSHLKEGVKKVKHYAIKHKLISAAVIAVVVLAIWGIGRTIANGSQVVTYTVGTVAKGTIMSTVSGSGQVSASQQVEIKPKASGDVTAVKVVQGQSVKSGALLVQLDASDAAQAVREATLSLRSAELSLEKVKSSSVDSLEDAKDAVEQAQDSLTRTYDDAFTAISNAFLDLPNVMSGVTDILYGTTYSPGRQNFYYYYDLANNFDTNAIAYYDSVVSSYDTAKTAYDKNFLDYKALSRYSDTEEVEELLLETYDTAKLISDAVKNVDNFLNFVNNQVAGREGFVPSSLATHRSSIASYTSKANSHLSSLLNNKSSISTGKSSLVDKTEALTDLQEEGDNSLDLDSAQLTVSQRKNSLYNAQRNLADYSIRAPFDGMIAAVNVKKGDSASSGTAVATIITTQSLVDISLNEVDIINVHQDDKATVTFDAIEDLSISGTVATVDMIATTNQGVVSYNATIAFDTQDERIKPGMSASATIITSITQDVLVVPSSAVKTQGSVSYVEVPNSNVEESQIGQAISLGSVKKQVVTIGGSDDTSTEIVSGLNEGDQVIIKTTTAKSSNKSTTKQSTTSSILGGASEGPSMGGGGMMMPPQ